MHKWIDFCVKIGENGCMLIHMMSLNFQSKGDGHLKLKWAFILHFIYITDGNKYEPVSMSKRMSCCKISQSPEHLNNVYIALNCVWRHGDSTETPV